MGFFDGLLGGGNGAAAQGAVTDGTTSPEPNEACPYDGCDGHNIMSARDNASATGTAMSGVCSRNRNGHQWYYAGGRLVMAR